MGPNFRRLHSIIRSINHRPLRHLRPRLGTIDLPDAASGLALSLAWCR